MVKIGKRVRGVEGMEERHRKKIPRNSRRVNGSRRMKERNGKEDG